MRKPTRRDLLAMGGGAMAGLIFTPVPWKLLDDISIWTQNWPWIPQPARGPVEVKHAACALCPGGCGLRVRMAGGWPVGVAGAPGHPLSRGALCPLAFGAHQLNWHPRRLRGVLHRGRAASWQDALTAFRRACAEGPVTILDGRPRRAASRIFQRFVAPRQGSYSVAHAPEERALIPYQAWSGVPAGALGYDLESARTVLSFGAPLLDGWGTPGRFARLWSERAAGMADPALRLIQVEPSLSRTAAAAWRWVPNRPGSEAAVASALARVLMEERLVSHQAPMPQLPIGDAAAQAGLTVEAIRELARVIVAHPPVLAISADNQPAVAALNVLLGGRIVKRREPPAFEKSSGSPRAILVDSTVPWEIEPKTGAEVFRFAAWDGGGSSADWLLPAPGFLEELTDVPTPPASALATYAIAPDLLALPSGVMSAATFLAQVDATAGSAPETIQTRCEQLWRARAGTLHAPAGGDPVPVGNLESGAKLYQQLLAGAVWVDDARPQELRCELHQWPTDTEPRQPSGSTWTAGWAPPVLPPLAAKLYQESNLRGLPARSQL